MLCKGKMSRQEYTARRVGRERLLISMIVFHVGSIIIVTKSLLGKERTYAIVVE